MSFRRPPPAGPDPVSSSDDARASARRGECAEAGLDDWLRLQAALGLEPQRAAALLRRTPDPVAALRAAGTTRGLSESALRSARQTFRRLALTALPLPDARFPERLAAIADPPPLLLVRGDVALLGRPAAAIVGARAATAYGLSTARRLARELAEAGVVVVSGLARGIDAAAHAGALEAGGETIAVLACGLDRVYPPEHARLAEAVAVSGAVLSEFPLGTPPLRPHFPLRNRLISGLCDVVVVVEARERSGSLITARHALVQGRDVLAVPGPVDAATSVGPNRLLRDGARPLLGVADVLEEMGWRARERSREPGPRPDAHGLTGAARELWAELLRGPGTRDELAERMGCGPGDLAAAVLELELQGRAREDRDGRLRAEPRRQ